MVIATSSLEGHFCRLREVFAARLKLNPKQFEVLKESVKYLGKIVDPDGVRQDPEQAAVIRAWKTPRNLKEMERFLELPNYY